MMYRRIERKRAPWGAIIGAAGSLLSSGLGAILSNNAQKKQLKMMQQQQDLQASAAATQAANADLEAESNYLDQFKMVAKAGGKKKTKRKRLRDQNPVITDGGYAIPIGNKTFLLKGGSHQDINETGQTGIGINTGKGEIEAENNEVVDYNNDYLRVFSTVPMLDGISPAEAVLLGANKNKVFDAQEKTKKALGINDDGSPKYTNGGTVPPFRGEIRIPTSIVEAQNTPLNDEQEKLFNVWLSDLASKRGITPNDFMDDYDYRGFWLNEPEQAVKMLNGDKYAHFTDKYKKVNHPTFSTESRYSNMLTPGGEWDRTNNGRYYYIPSNFTRDRRQNTINYLKNNNNYAKVPEGYYDRFSENPRIIFPKRCGGRKNVRKVLGGVDDKGRTITPWTHDARLYKKSLQSTTPTLDLDNLTVANLLGDTRPLGYVAAGATRVPEKGTQDYADFFYGTYGEDRDKYIKLGFIPNERERIPEAISTIKTDRQSFIPINPIDINYNTETSPTEKIEEVQPNTNNKGSMLNEFKPYSGRSIYTTGDYLTLGAQALGSLGSSLIGYLSSRHPYIPARPAIIPAGKLKTNYNINPQVTEARRQQALYNEATRRGTSSSAAALDRMNRMGLATSNAINKLYAEKENKEAEFINEDIKNQQQVAQANAQLYSNWQKEVADARNKAMSSRISAVTNLPSNLAAAVTNFVRQGEQRYNDEVDLQTKIALSDHPMSAAAMLSGLGNTLSPLTRYNLYNMFTKMTQNNIENEPTKRADEEDSVYRLRYDNWLNRRNAYNERLAYLAYLRNSLEGTRYWNKINQ